MCKMFADGKRQERSRQGQTSSANVTASPAATPSSSSTAAAAQRCIVPVTPLTIGKVMSKDDAHYAPHRENPFPSRFRNATAKLVSSNDNAADALSPGAGELRSPPPSPSTSPPPHDLAAAAGSSWCPSPRTWRSHSLPGSSLVSCDGSRVFGFAADDDVSSADSAVEFDVADDSGLLMDCARRTSAEHAVMMVRCLEQLRVLLDTPGVDPSDDSPSTASVDEAVFSPTSSLSSRDDHSSAETSSQRPAERRPGPHERFRKLLERWEEAGQADVVLPARFRFADPHVMQRFGELRRMWESQQTTSDLSLSAAAAAAGSGGSQSSSGRRAHQADKQQ